ncbi:hypothetical protein [Kitasatospora sp. NPDC092286]|uniref:hypothetical protein n=1 Tax=Kitasatospora sp. NPDC092286 TaxID=3364087 RepID=UPI003819128A
MTVAAIGSLNFSIIEMRCPESHIDAVINTLNDADPTPAVINNAFSMVATASTVAWVMRRADNQALTYHQFRDLVRARYFGDLFRHAISIGADFDQIGDLAERITAALAEDPQLNS